MFNTPLIDIIRDRLTHHKQHIAVAESVTAGFLQAALASAEMASDFFEGGITAYNIDQKVKHLGIDRDQGEKCNCVSQITANEMASGVCRLFDTFWGISVTGYATPVKESDFEVYAYYAVCRNGLIVDTGKLDLQNKKGPDAQLAYVDMILRAFVTVL